MVARIQKNSYFAIGFGQTMTNTDMWLWQAQGANSTVTDMWSVSNSVMPIIDAKNDVNTSFYINNDSVTFITDR